MKEIFFETCLLAIRDLHYQRFYGNFSNTTPLEDLEKILIFFIESQVKVDLNYFNIAQPNYDNILSCFINKIFYRQLEIYNIIFTEVLVMQKK